jgi:hypothetical protein
MYRSKVFSRNARSAPYTKPGYYTARHPQTDLPPQPEDVGAAKKKRDVFDKCRDVLRTVYPINKSGSKICTIAFDVAKFVPYVTFSKPGYIGVKLDRDAYFELMFAKNDICGYLNGNFKPTLKVLSLSDSVILEYTCAYKKPTIIIVSDKNTDYERSVSIAAETWNFLESLFTLIEFQMKNLSDDAQNCKSLFDAMAKVAHAKFVEEKKQNNNGELFLMFENIIKRIKLDELDVMFVDFFDPVRVFYELKAYCILELSAKVQEIDEQY